MLSLKELANESKELRLVQMNKNGVDMDGLTLQKESVAPVLYEAGVADAIKAYPELTPVEAVLKVLKDLLKDLPSELAGDKIDNLISNLTNGDFSHLVFRVMQVPRCNRGTEVYTPVKEVLGNYLYLDLTYSSAGRGLVPDKLAKELFDKFGKDDVLAAVELNTAKEAGLYQKTALDMEEDWGVNEPLILTNKDRFFGATGFFACAVVRKVVAHLLRGAFYATPLSVHEMIIIKDTEAVTQDFLRASQAASECLQETNKGTERMVARTYYCDMDGNIEIVEVM